MRQWLIEQAVADWMVDPMANLVEYDSIMTDDEYKRALSIIQSKNDGSVIELDDRSGGDETRAD